jgi:hypothetical protein
MTGLNLKEEEGEEEEEEEFCPILLYIGSNAGRS